MSRAILGLDDPLLDQLSNAIGKARKISFNVAFIMESGAKLLAPMLGEAVSQDAIIRILTGSYLGITEPPALYFLRNALGDAVDLRFYSGNAVSFHPKTYLFEYDDDAEVFVGSSNISKAALTNGLEWYYSFLRSEAPEAYVRFSETFNQLFTESGVIASDEVLRDYALRWKKPRFVPAQPFTDTQEQKGYVEPRGAQIEALYELKKARAEGVNKALVVAATGVGKTYLAAFDSKEYAHVLFLAHREEILKQAEKAFRTVRPAGKTGFYMGNAKDEGANIYFATVQSLARRENIQNFSTDFFDYIIIDEFHHAAADSYLEVLEYFQPNFLLGLTATPYRMDNRDIYALCDDNVVYEIYLKEAINRGFLASFRYWGVYDNTDYAAIRYSNGKYVLEDLEKHLIRLERANLVLEKYKLLAGKRTLGFCASIAHADSMAKYFNDHGIKAVAVHSENYNQLWQMNRADAIIALEKGQIQVLFAVDMFNEGVDIPNIDTVMFLRPTDSFTVFLQQLGRGLRKAEGKDYLRVLDFIGNYKRAHYIPALLAGENPLNPRRAIKRVATDYEYPLDCQVNFDLKLLDLFQELSKRDPLKKRMQEDFFRLYEEMGRRPTRVDVLEGSDIPIREFLKQGWLRFLKQAEILSSEEASWLNTEVEEFLRYLEKTSMTKAYKIPTVAALLDDDSINPTVSLTEIGRSMLSFYHSKIVHQKDLRDKSNRNWRSWSEIEFAELARKNPVRFLSRSRFFLYDEINKIFALLSELHPFLTPNLAGHVRDILEYRRRDFFRKRYREEN